MRDKRAKKMVEDYLAEVGRCFQGTAAERKELLGQLESYINDAVMERTCGSDADVAAVKTVLDEMDPPESYGQPSMKKKVPWHAGKRGIIISLVTFPVTYLLVILLNHAINIGNDGPFHKSVSLLPLYMLGQLIAFIFGLIDWKKPLGKIAVFFPFILTFLLMLIIA